MSHFIRCFLPVFLFLTLYTIPFARVFADSDPSLLNKTVTVEGKVIDSGTHKPLAGVNVIILNSAMGASTDKDGHFTIDNVPLGRMRLVASYMGYQSKQKTLVLNENGIDDIRFMLDEDIMETGTIVVTGTATPYLYEEAPVKTEVIPRLLIEQNRSCNLSEALTLQTGLRVENNCQNCNFTQVRILGFDGRYSQVLIDGDPVVSTLAGVYALEQFPQEMIEQIEIVKGGGSALYGGGAVAGAINLRTRKPYLNQIKAHYDIQNVNGAMDHRSGIMAERVSQDGHTGAFIFGSIRERDHYDHNKDGFSELGLLKHTSTGIHWFYRPFSTGEFRSSFHRITEERRGGNDFDRPEHEADIAESVNHKRWGGKLRWNQRLNESFNYQTYYAFSLLERQSYYGGLSGNSYTDSIDALKYYGNTDNQTHVAGLKGTVLAGNHQITFGSQYSADELRDESVEDSRYHIDNLYTNIGIYIQDDLKFGDDRYNLVFGARLDKHSQLAQPVISPRLNIKYTPVSDLHFRASFTTGFKAPQTFDEDLHVESLGGDQRVVRNAPDLQPEKSRTISAGMEFQGYYGNFPVLFGITGFYSVLSDAFSEVELSNPQSDLILWQRVNSTCAQVRGVELDLGYKPTNNLEFRSGVTYKSGRYDAKQEIFNNVYSEQFLRTPNLFGYLRTIWIPKESFTFLTSVKYTGHMYVPNEAASTIVETQQSFVELGVNGSYQLAFIRHLQGELMFGVKNITNAYQNDLQKGVDRDPAYVYGPQLPRRMYLGIEFSF